MHGKCLCGRTRLDAALYCSVTFLESGMAWSIQFPLSGRLPTPHLIPAVGFLMGYAFGFLTRMMLRVMRRFGAGRDQEVALTLAMVSKGKGVGWGPCTRAVQHSKVLQVPKRCAIYVIQFECLLMHTCSFSLLLCFAHGPSPPPALAAGLPCLLGDRQPL